MAWIYKGIEIDLRGEMFRAQLEDESKIVKPSLAAVKKEIDKRQAVKALALFINLPVVILRENSSFPDETFIFHGAITGLDPESREIIGIEAPYGWRNCDILPESKANTLRLEKLAAARANQKAAERSIEGRGVSLYIPKLSRNKPLPYGDAVAMILENYAAAKKGKGD